MPTFSKRRKAAFSGNRYCEVVLGSAVSLARGMFSKRLAGNPRELPILSHTTRNALDLGREIRATKGRPKEAMLAPRARSSEGPEHRWMLLGWQSYVETGFRGSRYVGH
jgi:hypothetical protein